VKNCLLISACLLLVIVSGCSKGTAAIAKVPAATTQTIDYKTSLDKLCGDILKGLVDVETETNGDRVLELDKRIKADFANCPKVPSTNDSSDVICELSEKSVASFGLYCEFISTAIRKEKNDAPDAAKTERDDCKAIKTVLMKDVDKLLTILAESK